MGKLFIGLILAGMIATIVAFAPMLLGGWEAQARIAEADSRARIAESTAAVAVAAVTANTLLVTVVVGGALGLAAIVLYFQLRKDEMQRDIYLLELREKHQLLSDRPAIQQRSYIQNTTHKEEEHDRGTNNF